jgi:two-component system response regulator RegA
VVLDLRMPGPSGLELLPALRELAPEARILLVTGYASIPVAVDAVRLGADGVVQKPVGADGVLAAFERSAEDPLSHDSAAYEPPSLARAEWEHIQRVLEDCEHNITEAARRLGLHRRTLQRKLQKYPPRE